MREKHEITHEDGITESPPALPMEIRDQEVTLLLNQVLNQRHLIRLKLKNKTNATSSIIEVGDVQFSVHDATGAHQNKLLTLKNDIAIQIPFLSTYYICSTPFIGYGWIGSIPILKLRLPSSLIRKKLRKSERLTNFSQTPKMRLFLEEDQQLDVTLVDLSLGGVGIQFDETQRDMIIELPARVVITISIKIGNRFYLKTGATIRYSHRNRCGLKFRGITQKQKDMLYHYIRSISDLEIA